MSEASRRQRGLYIGEAARELGVSVHTVRREIARGRLTHRREGMRRIVFDPQHLEEYRARNTFEADS